MTAQLRDIARAPGGDSIVGLRVLLPQICAGCGGAGAIIGAGKGPHKAALLCECGRHAGWLSVQSFNFISEIVRRFGRPVEPILVRTNHRNSPPAKAATDAAQPRLPFDAPRI